jgi:hypothetical protein
MVEKPGGDDSVQSEEEEKIDLNESLTLLRPKTIQDMACSMTKKIQDTAPFAPIH